MVLVSIPAAARADAPAWRTLLDEAQSARSARRYHDALQLSDRAAFQGDEARYHAARLRGDTLLDAGQAAAALSTYDSIADLAVPDSELDCARGVALFELGKFPEANNALRSALRGKPDLAEAYYTLGLLAEILGTPGEEELFRRARQLDSDRYPITPLMAHDTFVAAVDEALASVPAHVARALTDVPVLVVDVPHPEDLSRAQLPTPPTAMGMTIDHSQCGHPQCDEARTILLFKRNLERAAATGEQLQTKIRELVTHEVCRAGGLLPVGLV